MLVLTRKAGEEILIDGRIRIRVLQTSSGRIRLGIDAPPEVPVVRGELLEATRPIAREQTFAQRPVREGAAAIGAVMR